MPEAESVSAGVPESAPVLEVTDLDLDLPDHPKVLRQIGFSLKQGEVLGLVGESGSGKSVLSRTLVRLEAPGKITEGSILLDGEELRGKSQREMGDIRGRKISLALQNPQSAMDPVFRMGHQLREVFSAHSRVKKGNSLSEIYRNLRQVGISSPKERCRQYPHEWSRGMLQRAQLLMAFSPWPKVLILDEITSALDPTITLQILELIRRLKEEQRMGILLITHDLAIATEICDRIAVMRKGRIVETGSLREIKENPAHPYTRLLMSEIAEDTDHV